MADKVKYIAITEDNDNLSRVSSAGAKWWMPRSVAWLKRILFDPTVQDLTNDRFRGHMAVEEQSGEIVAIQCYYYQPMYFKRQKILAESGCIMGADPNYGAEIFCILEKNKQSHERPLIFCANDFANIKSASIHKFVQGASDAPKGSAWYLVRPTDMIIFARAICNRVFSSKGWLVSRFRGLAYRVCWLLTRPMQWTVDVCRKIRNGFSGYKYALCSEFPVLKFKAFWQQYLDGNDGLISSRDPERMKWLFDGSIRAEKVFMIVAEKVGEMVGYILMRWNIGQPSMEISDICALRNDEETLRGLVNVAVVFARKKGAEFIQIYDYKNSTVDWFKGLWGFKRELDHPTFLWRADKNDIVESLEQGRGWFFGPFDGERCMGYGGYVDL